MWVKRTENQFPIFRAGNTRFPAMALLAPLPVIVKGARSAASIYKNGATFCAII